MPKKPIAADSANENDPVPPTPCPTCGKPSVRAYRPFCSKRCADVDLQRWLTGRYAIPVVEDEDGPDDPAEDDPAGQGGRGSL
jgi:endogenous inhibitor of DNA gyrase (YacG/DUF329 family)